MNKSMFDDEITSEINKFAEINNKQPTKIYVSTHKFNMMEIDYYLSEKNNFPHLFVFWDGYGKKEIELNSEQTEDYHLI